MLRKLIIFKDYSLVSLVPKHPTLANSFIFQYT